MSILKNIVRLQHILLLCLTWFALTPCKVKESWLSVVDISYAQPLKSATTSVNSCQYFQSENIQTSSHEQSKVLRNQKTTHFYKFNAFATIEKSSSSEDSKQFFGHSPPKYILYKRLKLDIV